MVSRIIPVSYASIFLILLDCSVGGGTALRKAYRTNPMRGTIWASMSLQEGSVRHCVIPQSHEQPGSAQHRTYNDLRAGRQASVKKVEGGDDSDNNWSSSGEQSYDDELQDLQFQGAQNAAARGGNPSTFATWDRYTTGRSLTSFFKREVFWYDLVGRCTRDQVPSLESLLYKHRASGKGSTETWQKALSLPYCTSLLERSERAESTTSRS
jgi:hypothetical protein